MPLDKNNNNSLTNGSQRREGHPLSERYAMAGICAAAALAVSQALVLRLGPGVFFVIFFAASLVAGWYGGLGPGLLALVGGLLLADFSYLHSWSQPGLQRSSGIILMAVYAGVGAMGLAAIESLHRARIREEKIRKTALRLEQDAAEHSRAEEAQRQAKEKIESALETVQLRTWELDPQTGEIEWCSNHNALLEPKSAGVRQALESFLDQVHPEDRGQLKHALDKCALVGAPCDVEFRSTRSDGTVHWFLAEGNLVREEQQRPGRVSGILMDITERTEARQHSTESERFIRSALNSLGSHIAILDQDGTILEVNQAWRDFALSNGLRMASFGVGANYLTTCDQARGGGAANARATADGIRSVARGESPHFYLEYPCHSPTQKRWFVLRVTRFGGEGFMRLVVSHENVTRLKAAEEAVRQSEARARAQYKNFPIPTYTWQKQDGTFVLVDYNDAANAFTQGTIARFMSQTAEEMYPDAPEIVEEISRCFREKTCIQREMLYQFRSTGERKQLDVTYVYVPPDLVMIHCEDITERKRAEESVRQTQERYQALSDATFDAVVIHEQGLALEINHSHCEMFGYEPGEVLGKNVIDLLVEPESRETIFQHLQTGSEEPYEAWVRRKDGSKLLVELRGRNLSYKGRPARVVSAHDITKRKCAEEALRESERIAKRQVAELEWLYESTHVGRCFLDANLRFVRINKWLADVIGRPPVELIGRSVWEMVPAVRHIYEPILRKVLETGVGVKDLELHRPMLRDPAQTPRDWLVSLDVLKEDDHVLGLNAVVSEITERKRIEAELQRTLALLSTTLESTANGILVVDLAGKVVRYNQTFTSMWKIPQAILTLKDDARLLGHVLDQLVEPKEFLRKVQELKAHPEAESRDELRFKDGRVFERHSQPHRVGNEIVGRVWSFHDVTERKRSEEALRRSEAQLHELADAMPQIVWTALPDGRVEFVNRRWVEHSGGPPAEPQLPEAWGRMIHPEEADRAARTVRTAFQTGQSFQLEVRIKQEQVGYHWHLARALPLRDEAGRIFRWFGTCTDIEDQKRTEHDLQAATEQLDQHARTLERRVAERTAKLEEAIRSLEGVLYHIAHDLRAPLRAMAGFAQMLEENQQSRLDEEGKNFTERIVVGAKRMDGLIQDLLAYGRLGHSRMSFTRVSLETSIQCVLRDMHGEIRRKKAEIQVAKPLPAVSADINVLFQVLIQLLKNALTFVPPGVAPRIRIWAEQRSSSVRLWIQDNGIGIETEHHQRIFRVFERLHSVDEYTGTGIGLAIVCKGVERMGGTVGVESKPGEGSRFWLELPEAADEG